MAEVTFTIDGKEVKAQEGEYILNVARANGIFIPAICYLSRCSPTLACRICLVEIDGKQAYACNAKAKEGIAVSVHTENIEKERRAIMEVYDVNHPLQCGVCDQSGECELQNYTLEVGVDSQSYAIKDSPKEVKQWGHIKYDPGLCIVCERCVTVCKDMIGDAALKTVPRGGDALAAEYKESMPKDAYAMWNKLNKSLIGLSAGGEMLDCTSCGECAEVCPVGALVGSDFQYKSNAWELEQTPSTCPHCSAGCQLFYETKHTSIANSGRTIYRVTNEWNYVSLCGAGRYAYDFENRVEGKDTEAFKKAVEAFEKADTIHFTSTISNEEAQLLEKLKEQKGYKLVNAEAKALQDFLKGYASSSGKQLYSGDLKTIRSSDFVVSVGGALKSDNPNVRFAMNNALSMNKGAGLYFHPVKDPVIEGMNKNLVSINHAPLQEEAVMYLLLDLFAQSDKLPEEVKQTLASYHKKETVSVKETIKEEVVETVVKTIKDEESGEEKEVEEEVKKLVPKVVEKQIEVEKNLLFDLVGAPAKFEETLEKLLKKKASFSLIVGPDFYAHPKAQNLAKLVALFEKVSAFSVTLVPRFSNSLGVALINSLDEACGSYTVGYNTTGDFTLSALGEGDLDMPSLNQQKGTLTSIDKRVAPLNAVLEYKGYTLSDIAAELADNETCITEYTKLLPASKGFKPKAFIEMDDYFTNAGEEIRGYVLENVDCSVTDEAVSVFDAGKKLEGEIIYLSNPVRQFTPFTAKAHQQEENGGLYVSESYAKEKNLNEGDNVNVKTKSGELQVQVKVDNKIDGTIPYISSFDASLKWNVLFEGYVFENATITKV